MVPSRHPNSVVRFGLYELDLETGVLHKQGIRIKLQRQPALILALLVRNAGSVVTRETIRSEVWGEGTFVDFEHGLNSAIKKIRQVLLDSAETPRYIETVPKVGYRFLPAPEYLPAVAAGRPDRVVVLPLRTEDRENAARVTGGKRYLLLASGVVLVLVAASGIWWMARRSGAAIAGPVRFTIALPAHLSLDNVGFTGAPLAFSPDGSEIVVAAREGRTSRLYRRRLRDSEFEPVAGSEGGRAPVYSADGGWLVFADPGLSQLKRIPIGGGVPQKLYTAEITFFGLFLTADNRLFFGECGMGLMCRREDGTVEALTSTTKEFNELGGLDAEHCYPELLPGGRKVLFTATTGPQSGAIQFFDFDSRKRSTVLRPGIAPRYLPRTGHLVYAWNSQLYSVPFDARSATVGGKPSVVLRGVTQEVFSGAAHFAVSSNGSLAYLSGSTVHDVGPRVWTNNKGEIDPVRKLPYYLNNAKISPDGGSIAFVESSGDEGGLSLWVYDIATGVRRRLTDHRGKAGALAWCPDSRRLVVNLARESSAQYDLYLVRADGVEELTRLTNGPGEKFPGSVSPDGRWLLFTSRTRAKGGAQYDIQLLDLTRPEKGAEPFLATQKAESLPEFSPDGRWVAFVTNAYGSEPDVAVCRFDNPGRVWKVSEGGAIEPVWSRQGGLLYFRDLRGAKVVSAVLDPAQAPNPISSRQVVFQGRFFPGGLSNRVWDLHPDGKSFLFPLQAEKHPAAREIAVVLNWDGTLPR